MPKRSLAPCKNIEYLDFYKPDQIQELSISLCSSGNMLINLCINILKLYV